MPQGDPLSILLFAAAMTVVVRQAIATLDLPMQSVSYIDDRVLLGDPDAVAAVLQELPHSLLAGPGVISLTWLVILAHPSGWNDS